MAARVCLLSASETYALETYAVIPDCTRHRHTSRKNADELESPGRKGQFQDGATARRVKAADGKRRSTVESGACWQKVTPRYMGEKLGTASLQLTRGRAGYIPSAVRNNITSQLRKLAPGRTLMTGGTPVEA